MPNHGEQRHQGDDRCGQLDSERRACHRPSQLMHQGLEASQTGSQKSGSFDLREFANDVYRIMDANKIIQVGWLDNGGMQFAP